MDTEGRAIHLSMGAGSTPHEARRAVARCLGADVPAHTVRDALLMTSELATNAAIHTDGGYELTAQWDLRSHSLRVEISDHSPLPAERRLPGSEGVGGFGLHIVDALATRWGTTPTPTGKSVWFELGWT